MQLSRSRRDAMKTTLVTFCALLVLSALSSAQSNTLNPLPNTIFVGADGKFETAPDTALIQFNIAAKADNAKDAYDQAAKQSRSHRHRSAVARRPRAHILRTPARRRPRVADQPSGGGNAEKNGVWGQPGAMITHSRRRPPRPMPPARQKPRERWLRLTSTRPIMKFAPALALVALLASSPGCKQYEEVYSVSFRNNRGVELAGGDITLSSPLPATGMIRGWYTLQIRSVPSGSKEVEIFYELFHHKESGRVEWTVGAPRMGA